MPKAIRSPWQSNRNRMNDKEAEVIEAIYVCGLGETTWVSVLAGIQRLTSSRLVGLATTGAASEVLHHAGEDEAWAQELILSYNNEFHHYDRSLEIMSNWEAGRWYDDREWSTSAQRARSVTHQEFLRPRGMCYWEGTYIRRTQDVSHFLTLAGGESMQSESYRDPIARIYKHLGRAVRMRVQLDTAQGKCVGGWSMFDALNLPAFLLDEHRRLVHANAVAQTMMRCEKGFQFVHGCFSPEGCSDAGSWRVACDLGAIVIPRQASPHEPLVMTLTPVAAQTRLAGDLQRPLILMSAPALYSAPRHRRALRLAFHLTVAEIEICLLLCQEGLSPQECADRRQVEIGTVRAQIKSILVKAGVKRLPQLVGVVARL